MVRAVYDTNVIISGLIWSGKPGKVLRLAAEGHVETVTSESLVEELHGVLQREKFEKYLRRLKTTPDTLVNQFLTYTRLVEPQPLPQDIVRDIKDVQVLEAAVGGDATCVVSGDDDLLSMEQYAGIRILDTGDFLAWVNAD